MNIIITTGVFLTLALIGVGIWKLEGYEQKPKKKAFVKSKDGYLRIIGSDDIFMPRHKRWRDASTGRFISNPYKKELKSKK